MSVDFKNSNVKLYSRNGDLYTRTLITCIILALSNPRFTTGNKVDETDCPIPGYDYTKVGCLCEQKYKNCSSGPRHTGDSHFNCALVKNFKGWSKENVTNCTSSHCKPSLILKITLNKDFNPKSDEPEIKMPVLNITFTVPQAYVGLPTDVGPIHGFYPGGILLNLSTLSEQNVIYPKSPPLFDFFGYSSISTDNFQPRNITFPCIYGFRNVENKTRYTVYVIELKTFSKRQNTNQLVIPFTSIRYNITMYNYYAYRASVWKTTMAVAQYPTQKDLYVVFDPAPEIFKTKIYHIFLIDINSWATVQEKQVIHASETYSTIFTNIVDGFYKIKIVVQGDNCTGSCKEHWSHKIVMDNVDELTGVDQPGPDNIVIWPILGSVIICTLLITVFLFFWKHRHSQNKLVSSVHSLLLYSNSQKVNCRVAKSFVEFLRERLKMHVTYDLDEQALVVQDISNWYTSKLDEVDHVIVLWFPGANRSTSIAVNTDSAIQDYFLLAVMKALCLKENRGTGFKLSCVFFDYTQNKTISRAVKQNFEFFHLFKNFEKFYKYVNERTASGTIRKSMKKSEYRSSSLYSAVLEAIEFYKDKNQDLSIDEDDLHFWKNQYYENNHCVNENLNNNESNENVDNGTATEDHWSVDVCPIHGSKSERYATGGLTDDMVTDDLHEEFIKLNFENRVPLNPLPSASGEYYPISSQRGDNSHLGHDQHRYEMDHLCDNNRFQFHGNTTAHVDHNGTVKCELFLDMESGDHKKNSEMEDSCCNNYRAESSPLLHPVSDNEALEEVSDDDNCRTYMSGGNIFPQIVFDENNIARERTVHKSLLDLKDRHSRQRTLSLNSNSSFNDGLYTDSSGECYDISAASSDDSFQKLNIEEKYLYLNS